MLMFLLLRKLLPIRSGLTAVVLVLRLLPLMFLMHLIFFFLFLLLLWGFSVLLFADVMVWDSVYLCSVEKFVCGHGFLSSLWPGCYTC